MLAFALRLRRAKLERKSEEEVKDQASKSASYVVFGCLCCFFGCLFYLFERVGNCHCNLDLYGLLFVSFGSSIVFFHCIVDYYGTFREIYCEEAVDDDASDAGTDASSLSDPNDSPLLPKILSFSVCPEHDAPLIKSQSHLVFPCTKSKIIREYNLPSVVVEI